MTMLWLLLALQDAAAIDAAVKAVPGMDSRKWRGVDDAAYLSRVTQDLWSEAPTDATSFLDDKTPDKRRRKVDELLASPKFAETWGRRLSGWLIGDPADYRIELDGLKVGDERRIADAFTEWMVGGVKTDVPWNDIVRRLIVARGESGKVPELAWSLSFTRTQGYAAEFALGTGRLLGIRVYCARCHDHPYERWSVQDFYGLAAFGVRSRVRRMGDGAELGVSDEGDLTMPLSEGGRKGGVVGPTFLFGGAAGKNDDRLKVLANLMTSPSNTQTSRAFVNRVWAWLFGKGVVNPPDEFSMRNKPSSPVLMNNLVQTFLVGKGALKPLLRAILASEIYAIVETEDPAKADGASFRNLIVRESVLPARPFGPFKLQLPPEWVLLSAARPGFRTMFRVPGKGGPGIFGTWSGTVDECTAQVVGGKPAVEIFEGPVKVLLTDLTGTYTCDPSAAGPRLNWRILVGRVSTDKARQSYRLEGPADTVAEWRESLVDLLKKAVP